MFIDLPTPAAPAKRLESFPEMPLHANPRVDARLGAQWFVCTNSKLLVRRCMRYSMTETFFMPFGNTRFVQPSLSLQIRDLEHAVGAPLFHRIPQGAELTEAGKAFHDLVRNIPDHVGRATQLARRTARGELGALTIGYTNSSALNPVFSAALRSYRRTFPGVALSLKESHTAQLIDGLLDGELDVVFVRPVACTAGKIPQACSIP